MIIKIILAITIMSGVAVSVIYQKVEQKVVNPVSAQIGGGCSSYIPDNPRCGDNESCGLGTYTESAAFYIGPGIKGIDYRNATCENTTCGIIPNVRTAYDNEDCCDQDGDGYSSPSCGGAVRWFSYSRVKTLCKMRV